MDKLNRLIKCGFFALMAAINSAAFASPNLLLAVQTGYPDIFSQGTPSESCVYDSTAETLTITSQTLTLTPAAGAVPSFFAPGSLTSLTLNIATDGTFSSGTVTVSGMVNSYTNPVLEGVITTYGIADLNLSTDRIEMLFTTSGGTLASDMGGIGAEGGIIVALFN